MSIQIETPDLSALTARYAQAQSIIRDELTAGVTASAQAGQAQAMRLVGVKTGTLRRSIVAKPGSSAGGTITASYGTNVPYARYHEEGRGAIDAGPGRVLRFTIGGQTLFRRRVGPAKGRFYMKKSRDWLEPQVATEMRKRVQNIIRRLGG
jgi:hypothetical protein